MSWYGCFQLGPEAPRLAGRCALAAAKPADVKERLTQMIELRDELRVTLKEWDGRLDYY